MRIGYACQALGVPGTRLKSITLKNATPQRIYEVADSNLSALEKMLEYDCGAGIPMQRVSSDIVPFATHPQVRYDWQEAFAPKLAALGEKARAGNIRLSMHPGQYTVLNSPNPDVVQRAVEDLDYHCRFLDLMGMDRSCKVILHVGGAYGDKPAAIRRFSENYERLDASIRKRLILENDDTTYTIAEVLQLGKSLGAPVVFDNLHNAVNPSREVRSEWEWIAACAETWGPKDGTQKLHYSQQAQGKKPGSHSATIAVRPFLDFVAGLKNPVDIMLEVKDKNLSAVKCILCTDASRGMGALEAEWARYKYAVLGKAPAIYSEIRTLLKDKTAYPAATFYAFIDAALAAPEDTGAGVNAAQHIWGYCKHDATDVEKKRFAVLLAKYGAGESAVLPLKRFLLRLAQKYGYAYLQASYYFLGIEQA